LRGNVVFLGGLTGMVEIGPFLFDGSPGWLLWRFIHLVRMRTVRKSGDGRSRRGGEPLLRTGHVAPGGGTGVHPEEARQAPRRHAA